MGSLETLQQRIQDFAGYGGNEARRLADEQVRAYVGERLAAVSDESVNALESEDRERYDRLLVRSEFLNQVGFAQLETSGSQPQLDAIAGADASLVQAADRLGSGDLPGILKDMERAFDARDAAMAAA